MGTIPQEVFAKYVKKGWSVFPVVFYRDNDGKIVKKPAVTWKDYQTRKPTLEEIETWDNKYTGIGLVTGEISRVVVIDIDTPDISKINLTLRSPMIVKSAFSDGYHYYYRWDDEIRNTTKIDGLPVDFRGDGGYVVLPPSNFEGKKYTFETHCDPMFLDVLPKEIKKNIQKPIIKTYQPSVDHSDLPEAFEGNRNDTAARVAGSLITRIPKKLLETAGWPALLHWNQTKCLPPMEEYELRQTWQSILRTHTTNHVSETKNNFKIYSGSEAINDYNRMMSEWGSGISTGYEELDEYFTFMPQHLYLISATTHTGKTTFTLNLASKIALKHRVLFCSLEMGIFVAPKVTQLVGKYPEKFNLLTSENMMTPDSLIDIVESMTEKPEIIFVDHIHFFERNSENISQEIDKIILNIQSVSKKLELPIVLIAHTRKLNQDRPPRLDDLRDSSSLAQVPSVIIQLYRKENDTETMLTGSGYLSKEAMIFIQKNRIKGKTGAVKYTLDDNERLAFRSFENNVKKYLL